MNIYIHYREYLILLRLIPIHLFSLFKSTPSPTSLIGPKRKTIPNIFEHINNLNNKTKKIKYSLFSGSLHRYLVFYISFESNSLSVCTEKNNNDQIGIGYSCIE